MAKFIGTRDNDDFEGTDDNDLFGLASGGRDTASGLRGDDKFFLGGALGAGDSIDGGSGFDTMFLFGHDYALTLHPDTIRDIDLLVLAGSNSYDLTLADANIAAGQTMSVDASSLRMTDTLTLDASSETNGSLNVMAGAGKDTIHLGSGQDTVDAGAGNDVIAGGVGLDHLKGGAGRDTFVYAGVADSTNTNYDTIDHFFVGHDRFDLDVEVQGVNATITSGSLSDGNTYVSDFEQTVNASRLEANHAVVWIPDDGSDAGDIYVVVDANGVAGFQSGQDYIIELEDPAHLDDLTAAAFV